MKIKTGSKSGAEIGFDEKLESILKLDADTQIKAVTYPPGEIFLERGSLWIFRERDEAPGLPARTVLKIFTKDGAVRTESGGCLVQASAQGTWVKVFGDGAEVIEFSKKGKKASTNKINEGFKFLLAAKSAGNSFERLQYGDYAEWQRWVKTLYEKRDDRASERLSREIGV